MIVLYNESISIKRLNSCGGDDCCAISFSCTLTHVEAMIPMPKGKILQDKISLCQDRNGDAAPTTTKLLCQQCSENNR